MPRLSQTAIATLELVEDSPIEVVRRLRAPDELTDEQKAEFERVINGMPAEWFCPGNAAALVQYCRHVIMARRTAAAIEHAVSTGDAEALANYVRVQVNETKVINQLMTSLRMTPHSVAPAPSSQKKLRAPESPWRGFGKQQTQARPAEKD